MCQSQIISGLGPEIRKMLILAMSITMTVRQSVKTCWKMSLV